MRLLPTLTVALLLAAGLSHDGDANGRFDTKLTADQQVLHALNRLTFGPRPGDVDEVRRIGVETWIELRPGLENEQLYEGRDLAVTTDFRAVLSELVSGHLGQKDVAQVFPGYKCGDPLGLLRA
jgi:hypothetical protein